MSKSNNSNKSNNRKSRNNKNSNNIRKVMLIWLASIAIIASIIYMGFNIWIGSQLKPMEKSEGMSVIFEVKRGSGAGEIAENLEKKGLVRSSKAFKIKAQRSGKGSKFKAAVYSLKPSMSVEEIMDVLVEGKSETLKLTIQEGLDIKRIVEKLSAEGLVNANEFTHELEFGEFNYNFMSGLPAGANRLEGYLYPETYFVPVGSSAHNIINMLLGQFEKIYTPEIKAKADSMGLTTHQVVTMASILEREAVMIEEMPTIASVFYNRIKVGMPLQTDATIQYALGEQKKRLTYDDLKVDSPYNTYTNKGLPPGPIASPSKAALEAAVNPANTDYIFFVAKGDGSHAFSSDYNQFLNDKKAYISKVFGQ